MLWIQGLWHVSIHQQEVLKRLPGGAEEEVSLNTSGISDAVMEHLQNLRGSNVQKKTVRRKQVNVIPGKSVGVADMCADGRSGMKKVRVEDSDRDEEMNDSESDSDDESSDSSESSSDEEASEKENICNSENIAVGDFVAAVFDTWYVGQVEKIELETLTVNFMQHASNHANRYKWPDHPDSQRVMKGDILLHLKTKPFNGSSSSSTRALHQIDPVEFQKICDLYDALFSV